jgi:hypothetical protein
MYAGVCPIALQQQSLHPRRCHQTRALPIRELDNPPSVKMGLAHTRGKAAITSVSTANRCHNSAALHSQLEFARPELPSTYPGLGVFTTQSAGISHTGTCPPHAHAPQHPPLALPAAALYRHGSIEKARTRLRRSSTLSQPKVPLNTRRESREGLHTLRLLTPMLLPPTQHYIGTEAYDPRHPPHGRPYADAATSSTRAAAKGQRLTRHARVRVLSARNNPPLRCCHSTSTGFAHEILLPFAHPQAVATPTGIAQTRHQSSTATANPR